MHRIRLMLIVLVAALLCASPAAAAGDKPTRPYITGTAEVGQKLVGHAGTWPRAQFGSKVKIKLQWSSCRRGDCKFRLRHSKTYRVREADVGQRIRLLVQARLHGARKTVASKPTKRVTDLAWVPSNPGTLPAPVTENPGTEQPSVPPVVGVPPFTRPPVVIPNLPKPPVEEPPVEEPPVEEPPVEEPPVEEPPVEEPPVEEPGHPACAVYASPDGSDSNPGTATAPYRTFAKLAANVPDGTSGCLRQGTYSHSGNVNLTNGGTPTARVVIRSYPGELATVNGRIVVTPQAQNVTFYRLKLTAPASAVNSPVINAANFELSDSEVTNNHTGICLQVGSSYGRADNAWIHHNYIHDCGRLPATNHDHGIYVSGTTGFVIEDNVIVSNADRGVQLYGDNNNGQVRHNVISHNGQGVIISGVAGGNTDNTAIHHNVITFAQLRYNVESYWGDTSGVGQGNTVTNNCVFGGRSGNIQSPRGFTAANNVTADPQYAPGTWTPTNPTCAAVLEGHTPGIR